jgi:hypothetical protein
MHVVPDTTESGGHAMSGPLGGPATPALVVSSTTAAIAIAVEICRMTLSFSPSEY